MVTWYGVNEIVWCSSMKKDNSKHGSLTGVDKELAKHIAQVAKKIEPNVEYLANWLDSRLKEKGLSNDLKKR